jgi:hypothetical protein
MIELVNNYVSYLKDVKNIRSEQRISRYYQTVFDFTVSYLPQHHQFHKNNLQNLRPDMINDFLSQWLIRKAKIGRENDLIEAAKSLRFFITFLEHEGRLSNHLSKKLRNETHKSLEIIRQPGPPAPALPEPAPADLSHQHFGDAPKRRKDSLLFTLQNSPKLPPFIKFLTQFLKYLENQPLTKKKLKENDVFILDEIEIMMQENHFKPRLKTDVFLSNLIWLNEHIHTILFEKDRYVINTKFVKKLQPAGLWHELVMMVRDLYSFFPTIDNEYSDSEEYNFCLRFVTNMHQLPVNMWIEGHDNRKIYFHNQSYRDMATRLIRLSDASRNTFFYNILLLSEWIDLFRFRFEHGSTAPTAVMKTGIGNPVFQYLFPILRDN